MAKIKFFMNQILMMLYMPTIIQEVNKIPARA